MAGRAKLPRIVSQTALGAQPDRRGARSRRLALALASLLTCGLLWWQLGGLQRGEQYVLVVDAGSSGTRMLAYRWEAPSAERPGLPRLTPIPPSTASAHVPRRALGANRAYSRVETEPGLDQFVSDRKGLEGTALRPLLEWAQAALPRYAWRHTPLFLFGTAGLRRLPEADQHKLLAAAREVLGSSAFRFEPPWARVIEGRDEGVFGWVALNYLQGTLAPASLRHKQQRLRQGSAALQTVGALDLGGSSLEVSFAAESAAPVADQVNVSVLGTTHSLYCHVHHHYGLNDAFERSVSMLLRQPQRALPSSTASSGSTSEAGHTPGLESRQQAAGRVPAQQQQQHYSDHSEGGGSDTAGGSKARTQAEGAVAAGTQEGGSIGSHQANSSGSSGSSSSASAQLPEHAGRRRSVLLAVPEVLLRRLLGEQPLGLQRDVPSQQQKAPAARDAAVGWLQRQLLAEELAAGSAEPALSSASSAANSGMQAQTWRRRLAASGKPAAGAAPEGKTAAASSSAVDGGAAQRLPKPLLEVGHPCLHEGYSQPYKRLVIDGVAPEPKEVLIVGRPDYAACTQLASEVVNASGAGCPHCALGAPQPATSGLRFFALAGFYVVYHFFGLPTSAPLSDVQAAARKFCATPWHQVAAERAGEIHVDRYCFRAPYIASLLTQGLKLSEAQVQIGSPDVGWTLGAALVEGYQLAGLGQQDGTPGIRISAAALTNLNGGGWALLGAGAMLLAYAGWQRRCRLGGRADKRRGAEPLLLDVQLLPLTSPSPRLVPLGHSPFNGSAVGGAGSSGSKALAPPAGGSGGWTVSPRSPLQALGARLFGGSTPNFTKRRTQSWTAFDDAAGGAAVAAAANGGAGGLAPGRDVSYGSSLNRLARGPSLSRRVYGGGLAED